MAIVDSLRGSISRLSICRQKSPWLKYESTRNYSPQDNEIKQEVLRKVLADQKPISVWDLGANQCEFSAIAAEYCDSVVAWDSDSHCIQEAYGRLRNTNDEKTLPLVVDLDNDDQPEILVPNGGGHHGSGRMLGGGGFDPRRY